MSESSQICITVETCYGNLSCLICKICFHSLKKRSKHKQEENGEEEGKTKKSNETIQKVERHHFRKIMCLDLDQNDAMIFNVILCAEGETRRW